MRYKKPDPKNALSIIESSKRTMDFTLNLEVNDKSGITIIRNIYECFRMLGDALLMIKGTISEDHIMPIKEISKIKIESSRPISSVENLRILRHNVNYYGYIPNIIEVQDAKSLAESCFYKSYELIKKQL